MAADPSASSAPGPARPSAATCTRVAQASGALGQAAVRQMDQDLAWYRALSAQNRSWIGLVAQSGIASFVDWFISDQTRPRVTADVFGTAPRELARSISLAQTLDLLRITIGVVEREIGDLAAPGEADLAREAVLRYSREVAFAAAEVYAEAAEARGAWDARLESLVVDAVLRGEADDNLESRAAALGWGSVTRVAVLVAPPPIRLDQPLAPLLHERAQATNLHLLTSLTAGRLIGILGGVRDPVESASAFLDILGEGPVVVGPVVPHLFAAGRSARAALSGYAAAPARARCPRPVLADDLLPERALLADQPARNTLVSRIYRPLRAASGGTLLATATAYLEATGGVEGTARALIVHPNTVRYRLRSITQLTGLDLSNPHDGFTARVALALGRAADQPARPFPRATTPG